jgi:hypothetical protein
MFAYFDETIGGARHELTAVAGYVFDTAGASWFERRYREFVEPMIPSDKAGRKMFHAAACYDGDDQYFGLQRPVREAILGRMASVIGESVLMGIAVGVERPELRRGMRGRYGRLEIQGQPPSRDLAPWLSSPYSMCLFQCMEGIARWLDSEHPCVSEIEYIIEAGCPQEAEAKEILTRVAASQQLAARFRRGKHSFIPKGPDTPCLFAPDFYAWEWQRYDRLTANDKPPVDARSLLQPALDAKPHLASYMMEGSINVQAMINASYGLMPLKSEARKAKKARRLPGNPRP